MRVTEFVTEESAKSCPPATQDITLNLKNRQKAIDEYGYGPLNPDLPNTKFWMAKVDEWNLDSAEEAKQSLCGNCAAFDQREATLACIAQGIGSDAGAEDPTIEAGDLGYCRFLKFKCASRRTCDAWVTGGPLVDKEPVDENLHDWFGKEKWVRMDTKGNIKGPCAREPGEGKPKCLPQAKAHALGKKGRASAAAKKRREDPNPERSGPAKNVATKVQEGELVSMNDDPATVMRLAKQWWTGNPQQYAHAQQMLNRMGWDIYEDEDDIIVEKNGQQYTLSMDELESLNEADLDENCWKGYHKEGNKELFGKTVPNCVKNEAVAEGEGSYPEILYHGSTQEIKGPLTPRQAHDIGGAPGSNKNAIYATDDPNFAIAYSLAERGSDTGTLGWKQDPHLIFFGGKIRHGQNVYLYTLPTRDQQGNPLFTPGGADAEWYSVPGVTAVTPIKVKELPVDRYLGLLRKPTPDEQKVFQANQARDKAKRGMAEGHETCPECGGAMYPDTMITEKQDACYYKVKSRYKVWPSAYASGALVQCRKRGAANWGNKSKNESQENSMDELSRIVELSTGLSLEARAELAEEFDLIESIIDDLAEHNGVDSEVIWEDLESLDDDELYVFATTTTIMETEAWQKANNRDRTDGMSRKAVKAYRREHPGSKLKTAVTTKPSKLKKGSKASKRRKSYCSRSRGQMKMHNISCAKTPDKAICKARRRWNC
jgi:hypothetical protein